MSDKSFEELCETDRRIRRLFPTEMWNNGEVICIIKFFGGFELFNTRPYHNYETWSEGYSISAGDRYKNVSVEAEDLDDAVTKFETLIKDLRSK